MAVSDLFSPDIAKRQARERSQKLMAARLEKLELLARHYLIDDLEGIARYLVLSLCLATDFVPGFWDVYSHETPRGRGRPKALAPHVLLNLVEGLRRVRSSQSCLIRG
jgi:hypothetical protein